ncbi:hypothetical protein [Candidatus Enterococcus clewellii]|uniref:Uncharacterized protein n=1 Tax=Candidatus Enterococcus clewellii TaxID=1834193 RepID=A0A242K3X0_9ENTE|nr:hypothetical protein [Enterococcus sp. 9E7_DIV0242]OTP13695.1 hypothetical protein A5888_003173 [Enterococcus sp. 9E7_DIV0242]
MIQRIRDAEHLRSIYTADKAKNNCGDVVDGKLVRAFACTSNPLMFMDKEGRKIVTNEWFVNYKDELIFNIKKNYWINMKLYVTGESAITDRIYYLESEAE